ncbi:hypothetical protein NPX13_g9935 [Xylaria arbuscula]|uniref:Uncharacterized protein n=1 Tax=Xylaria arbuscula TaxID=114810 RepID=A0A9W8TH92_9PEZI|nr:hypothetical protein NPX13_g9935 [Xylaria arbuscula]
MASTSASITPSPLAPSLWLARGSDWFATSPMAQYGNELSQCNADFLQRHQKEPARPRTAKTQWRHRGSPITDQSGPSSYDDDNGALEKDNAQDWSPACMVGEIALAYPISPVLD